MVDVTSLSADTWGFELDTNTLKSLERVPGLEPKAR